MHLGEEIETLSTQFFNALLNDDGTDARPVSERLEGVLNPSTLPIVTSLYAAITPHDDMNDTRLDALMAIWPEYAALVEELYADSIAPLWHEV